MTVGILGTEFCESLEVLQGALSVFQQIRTPGSIQVGVLLFLVQLNRNTEILEGLLVVAGRGLAETSDHVMRGYVVLSLLDRLVGVFQGRLGLPHEISDHRPEEENLRLRVSHPDRLFQVFLSLGQVSLLD